MNFPRPLPLLNLSALSPLNGEVFFWFVLCMMANMIEICSFQISKFFAIRFAGIEALIHFIIQYKIIEEIEHHL